MSFSFLICLVNILVQISFDRPVMGSGTRWMTQWCIPVTSRLSLISRLMSSFTWGNIYTLSSAVHISVASRDASLLQLNHLNCRIPEKKNTDASNIKQNMVHSGRTNMTPEQLKKSTFNGPLSSPQVAKVGTSNTIWRFDLNKNIKESLNKIQQIYIEGGGGDFITFWNNLK